MTYEEAIQHLFCGRINCLHDKEQDAELALCCVEALGRQIPKKPHKATTRYDEFIKYECPVCGGYLIKNYPCKCGQMINWSDEE